MRRSMRAATVWMKLEGLRDVVLQGTGDLGPLAPLQVGTMPGRAAVSTVQASRSSSAKPCRLMSGARRSCETMYAKRRISSLASCNAAVRSLTRCSSSSWACRSASSACTRALVHVADASKETQAVQVYFAHRQRDRKRRAIPALSADFPPDADDVRLTHLEVPHQVAIVFLPVRRGHEHPDVLSNHFVGGIAKEALGCWVDRLNGPTHVDGDNAVCGSLEDGLLAGFTVPQCRLGLLARRDTADEPEQPRMLVLEAGHSGHGQRRDECRPLPRLQMHGPVPGGAVDLVEGCELRPKRQPLLRCHKERQRLAYEILLADGEQGRDGAIRLLNDPWLSVTRYPSGAKSNSA